MPTEVHGLISTKLMLGDAHYDYDQVTGSWELGAECQQFLIQQEVL
jgi:hypothetical protein